MWRLIFLIIISKEVQTTIDMNISEFQYLANHLHEEECRKLIASLHFKTYSAPNDLKEAELRVSKDIPCLDQLLHWNKESNEGKSETHEIVARRLRQIGRSDLANWLAKTSFNALGKDFDRLIQESSFDSKQPIKLPTVNLTTAVTKINYDNFDKITYRRIAKQDFIPSEAPNMPVDPTEWTIFDTISWTIVFVLLIVIIVLTIYLTLSSPCCKDRKRRKKRYDLLSDDESMYSPRRAACGLSECPMDTPSKCPNAKSKQKKSDVSVETVFKKESMPALELMGVEMPAQLQSPHTQKSSVKRSSIHRLNLPARRQQPSYYPHPQNQNQIGPSNVTQNFSPGMRTIDIHQKIAIPMNTNSS